MTFLILNLLVMLVLILIAAEIFTNALEHLGSRMGISEGVTGSLFAAVGTALPETLVPILAIFSGTENKAINEEIGVGAILGAPLMLSTLTIFLMASSVLKSRGLFAKVKPEYTGFSRDINFFLFAFTLSAVAMFIPHEKLLMRGLLSMILVATYFVYVILTFAASKKLVNEGHGVEAEGKMFFTRLGISNNMPLITFQLLCGLALLVFGAKGFIKNIEEFSHIVKISPLILSLLIIPIATELPEKINSIIWIRRGKDTMAFGNITGAMVFQGTLLPALGILLTPWQPRPDVIHGVAITLIAAAWLRLNARRGGIPIASLMVCGIFYTGYLLITFV